MADYVVRKIRFESTGSPRYPYRAVVDGCECVVRVNEFPREATMYSLFVDGKLAANLRDWPVAWLKPALASPPQGYAPAADQPAAGDDSVERAEYDRDLEHFQRTLSIRPWK